MTGEFMQLHFSDQHSEFWPDNQRKVFQNKQKAGLVLLETKVVSGKHRHHQLNFPPRDMEPSPAPRASNTNRRDDTFQLHKDQPTSLLGSAEECLF